MKKSLSEQHSQNIEMRVWSTVYIHKNHYNKQARKSMQQVLKDWLKEKRKNENLTITRTEWRTIKVDYEIPQYNFGKPLPRVEIRLLAWVIKKSK